MSKFKDVIRQFKELRDPREKNGRKFLQYSRAGNLAAMDGLQREPANFNYQDELTGKTALHYAVVKGDLQHIEKLLTLGVRGDVRDVEGETALMYAVRTNKQKIIKALVGANNNGINVLGDKGESVINISLEIGKDLVGKYLIDNGADPDRALAYAISHDKKDRFLWLIEHGASPDLSDAEGCSPLVKSIFDKNEERAKMWLELGADPNKTSLNGEQLRYKSFTPFMVALDQRQFVIADYIMNAKGFNVNTVNPMGANALVVAVQVQSEDMVLKLMNRGGNTKIISNEDMTLLHYAAEAGGAEIFDVILGSTKEFIDKVSHIGWTALMYASSKGSSRIVETLLIHGADASIQSPEQNFRALELAELALSKSLSASPDAKLGFEKCVEALKKVT